MIIEVRIQVTQAVLGEIERAPDPRFREVMTALVKHLHAFIREAKLTEEEFHQACADHQCHRPELQFVPQRGGAGVGLARRLDPGLPAQQRQQRRDRDHRESAGAVLAAQLPRTENGGSIIRSPTPGPELFVNAWAKDRDGKPVVGAEVDIWQSSTEGLYENQDPTQADMLDVLWPLWDDKNQALHDKFAATNVVRKVR